MINIAYSCKAYKYFLRIECSDYIAFKSRNMLYFLQNYIKKIHVQERTEPTMKIYHAFPGGRAKALTMSYDDGKLADVRLLEIFNRYGIKGTFNLNYGLMDMDIRLKPEQISRLYQGHEIATHTMTHPTIARCPLTQVAKEILEDREGLERITGGLVRGHAYPNGSYNEEIKDLFQKLGIAYARVVEPTEGFELPTDPMEWHPTCHHNHPRLLEMAQWFVDFPKKQYLKLMYVWGHSYEFDADDNWDRIEEFCRIVGGREDIWYATNIEIIDYMQVLRNLQFTADCAAVYNPSAHSAWLSVGDSDTVEVPGGEFVVLKESGHTK